MAANRLQLQHALHKPYDRVLFSRETPITGLPANRQLETKVYDNIGPHQSCLWGFASQVQAWHVGGWQQKIITNAW